MAGHSKWANIKHKKERQDAKKGKVFTKIIKELTVAAREGGADPEANPRLRLAIDKAISVNMPKSNIERAIDKGSGNMEGVDYISLRYEGYGVAGAALIVDCLTNNKTRTVADVRHAFTKNDGNLGTDGCVAYQFKNQGYLLFAPGTNEEKLMELALESGAEDVVQNEDGSLEIVTSPQDFSRVKKALDDAGFNAEEAAVTLRAENEVFLSGEEGQKMQRLINALEDLDDVQEVYTSAVIEE